MTGQPQTSLSDPEKNHLFKYPSLIMIILVGGFIRLGHVLPLDFPLNDGGAFYQVIVDIQHSGFELPVYTNYNLKQIPLAYPPLAFYIGGLLSKVFDYSVLDILRILPGTISIVTIPAFYLLSRQVLSSERQIIFSSIGFAFLPTSFDWLIVGGGLTRSFGCLFAILTLWQVLALYRSKSKKHILYTILFATLTILSHPGTAWFLAYSSAIIFLFHLQGEKKPQFIKTISVVFGVILLTSPWWSTLLIRHGLEVLTYPFQTETVSVASFLTPFTFLFTNEPFLDLLAVLGLLSVVVMINHRQYLLPLWLLSVFIFETRLGATYAVVPFALLVGVGFDQVVWPILFPHKYQRTGKYWRLFPVVALGFILLYIIINGYFGINYQSISKEERASMQWISENTPTDSEFIILSGQPKYGTDPISEWFPTLSQRTSQTTPQFHEWLPGNEFTYRIQIHSELQKSFLECKTLDLTCTLDWIEMNGISYSHIYLPASSPMYVSIENLDDLTPIMNNMGGIVLKR